MKKASKYSLKIEFSDGHNFDIIILSVTCEAVSLWIMKNETDSMYVISVNIKLIERNCAVVNDEFLAKEI